VPAGVRALRDGVRLAVPVVARIVAGATVGEPSIRSWADVPWVVVGFAEST
jgi:hypothetical protein